MFDIPSTYIGNHYHRIKKNVTYIYTSSMGSIFNKHHLYKLMFLLTSIKIGYT